jgi:ParB family transcriptional regulator, chromosome partitioning protein
VAERGMGRGLAAILAAAPRDDEEELRQVPVELISANPRQPRRQFDEEALVSLADSIRSRGVIQPVLVRPVAGGRYELVAGERRLRAARIAQLETVPAVVRQHDDADSLELAVIENMAREDLNPVEEARACTALVEELGLTREEVGLRVGRSRVAVSNLMRLLDLPDEVLELLERRQLSEGHGRALLTATDNSIRRNLARQAIAGHWSVRELETRARSADARRAAALSPRAPDGGDPDRQAAAEQIADALGAAFGADVKVRAGANGFTAQIAFSSLDEALALAGRLGG